MPQAPYDQQEYTPQPGGNVFAPMTMEEARNSDMWDWFTVTKGEAPDEGGLTIIATGKVASEVRLGAEVLADYRKRGGALPNAAIGELVGERSVVDFMELARVMERKIEAYLDGE